ncbi:hypothetical protein N9H39_02040 [Gammaproteobacteria bacterium]|nr:hypothetical protein [Gammaproteobacteria bacterium]
MKSSSKVVKFPQKETKTTSEQDNADTQTLSEYADRLRKSGERRLAHAAALDAETDEIFGTQD